MNINKTQAQIDVATPDGVTVQVTLKNSLASLTLRTSTAEFKTTIGTHETETSRQKFVRLVLPWLSRFLVIGSMLTP